MCNFFKTSETCLYGKGNTKRERAKEALNKGACNSPVPKMDEAVRERAEVKNGKG
jgi:hypothetical protein